MLYIDNLGKSFIHHELEMTILNEINLHIDKAEWCSIIGPSGAGKTTLLKCAGGLLEPETGKVLIQDQNLYSLSKDERSNFRRHHIGFVFQDFKLLPHYSVLDNVMLPLLYDTNKKKLMDKAKKLLQMVKIKESLFNRLPDSLSGGEKQRVAIARALIADPSLLLCDEPTGNLDTETRNRIIDLLLEIKSRGTAILCITHDSEVAEKGDSIYRLHESRLQRER